MSILYAGFDGLMMCCSTRTIWSFFFFGLFVFATLNHRPKFVHFASVCVKFHFLLKKQLVFIKLLIILNYIFYLYEEREKGKFSSDLLPQFFSHSLVHQEASQKNGLWKMRRHNVSRFRLIILHQTSNYIPFERTMIPFKTYDEESER